MQPARPRHPRTIQTSRRLRREATDAERHLWHAIRNDALGVRFRRQHPVGDYFADFACVEAWLVVEIDGGQHTPERDEARNAAVAALGWDVLRYWNNEVLENRDGVVADIVRHIVQRSSAFPPP